MIVIENTVLSGFFNVLLPEEGYVTHHLTGSYYVCEPPVVDTDIDILVLVKDREEYKSLLLGEGWEGCTGYEDKEPHSFAGRKGKFNLIVTDEVKWYTKFAAATELAKYVNIMNKELRIMLFELVLDDKKEESLEVTSVLAKAFRTPKYRWLGTTSLFGV